MENRSLTEKDKQRCVLDVAYRQVNDTMLDRKKVCIMLDNELGEDDLPVRYKEPTICKLDQAGMSGGFFHVRVYDETAIDLTREDLLADDHFDAVERCDNYLKNNGYQVLEWSKKPHEV